MSTTAKVLIITWMIVGFIVVGVAGFFLGRMTVSNTRQQSPPGIMQPGQQPPSNLSPSGSFQQPPQGGQQNFQQQQQQPPPTQGSQQNYMRY